MVIVQQRKLALQWQFYSLQLLPGDTSDHAVICTPEEIPENCTVRPKTPRTSVHLFAVPIDTMLSALVNCRRATANPES